jgi:hypothetical protein
MAEVLQRLQAALPLVERWIDALHAQHYPQSRAAGESGFSRLGALLPEGVLRAARFAVVETVPFPPVASYGLPEFQAMAAMPMAGITFRDMYFVHPSYATEGVHLHELIHVVQWRTLGVRPFLLTYALGIIQHGYEGSPLEAIAFAYQARFEQSLPIADVLEAVTQHAEQTRAEAAAVYAAGGINIGA